MNLAPGSRLGPYEIVAPLGAGGMGEVYRARDTRLDRTIAVKVLPPQLAADPEFRARFDREARAIGALEHPHICVLHDVGDHSGTAFLVMEHLEGETLSDRLRKGPLPLDQVCHYGIQIAEALRAAHRAGIVHRDLKPSNVMLVRRAGVAGAPIVKLLDFGLARSVAAAPLGAAVTMTTPLSGVGTVAGTLPYMAPEQLEGKPADERADVWAFGCVLYEMLTGRRAFEGESQATVIAAILGPPRAVADPANVAAPRELVHLIETCLQKDPDARWQNIGDVALHVGTPHLAGTDLALAPDGSRLAMARSDPDSGNSDIWVIDAGRGTESRWTSSGDRESDAVWSPDGRQIAYTWADKELRVREVERDESTSTRLFSCDGCGPFATDWSRDGRFLAVTVFLQNRPTIWLVPVSSADKPVRVTGGIQGRFSPDGRYIAYSSGESGRAEVYVQAVPPGTGRGMVSSDGADQPMWRGDGKELFFLSRSGDMMAARVATNPRFTNEAPVALFRLQARAAMRNQYVVLPDGQRFLVTAVDRDVLPISVIFNWTAMLKKP